MRSVLPSSSQNSVGVRGSLAVALDHSAFNDLAPFGLNSGDSLGEFLRLSSVLGSLGLVTLTHLLDSRGLALSLCGSFPCPPNGLSTQTTSVGSAGLSDTKLFIFLLTTGIGK